MSQVPRKYVTAQRNVQKEGNRSSYQTSNLMKNFDTSYFQTNRLTPTYLSNAKQDRLKSSDMYKSTSEAYYNKPKQEYFKGNTLKKKNQGMVSNLKTDLQNLKMEVSKLMNKDSNSRFSSGKRGKSEESIPQPEKTEINEYENFKKLQSQQVTKEVSDTCSVTSEKIIEQPLKRLQGQLSSLNYDHSHYLQLENNLLKTELRNLKNRYNAKKQEYNEKCEALEKKNEYLEVSLQKSQASLSEHKKILDYEIQNMKLQVGRQLQKEIEEQRNKKQTIPSHDFDCQNQLIENKLKELYEELSKKNKLINSLNIEFTQMKELLEKKTFELKKQTQKNFQLSKQQELVKRENTRLHSNLELQLCQTRQLEKVVEKLKEKNNSLAEEFQESENVMKGAEELEAKYEVELKQQKQREEKLRGQIKSLKIELRNHKQLKQSDKQQIKYLKQNNEDFMTHLEQMAKNLRTQKEKVIQVEENYRKIVDDLKQKHQEQLQNFKKQYQSQISNRSETKKSEEENIETELAQEKDRKINKWKAQYKILKIKYEEISLVEKNKKEEIETYYKGYKEYKSKVKMLEMKNSVLQQSANEFIEKIQELQTERFDEKHSSEGKIEQANFEIKGLTSKIEDLEREIENLMQKLQAESDKYLDQMQYRKKIEEKILNIDASQTDFGEIIEKVKKRLNEQDQKINKNIKEGKNKENLIQKLKKEVRQLIQAHEKQLHDISKRQKNEYASSVPSTVKLALDQLKKLSSKNIKIEQENSQKLLQENIELKAKLDEIEKQLMRQKHELKNISNLYNSKLSEYEELLLKAKVLKEDNQRNFVEIQMKNQLKLKKFQEQLTLKSEEIKQLRKENKKLIQTQMQISEGSENFDDALRTQIETTNTLREEINKKNDEHYNLGDQYSLLKSQYENLKSEFNIEKLKIISEKKNFKVASDIETQNIKKQLQIQKKKVHSLEEKIKLVVEESKKKDSFIQQYIIGKKLPQNDKEFMSSFLKGYEITLTGKGLTDQLKNESEQIEKLSKYNFSLVKEIAEMKEKLLLYEAIAGENLENEIIGLSPKRLEKGEAIQ